MKLGFHSRVLRGAGLLAVLLAGVPLLAADGNDLTIRIQDAIGVPGGSVAIVLRTYASKPIGQGQLCFRSTPSVPGSPALASLAGAEVFSQVGDALVQGAAELLEDPQIVLLTFESLSETINSADGPLGVIHLLLSDTVQPGQTFTIDVDLQNSSLIDDNGELVTIVPRSGELTIRAPGDPIAVSANGEDTLVGDVALLSMQTYEPIRIGLGQVGLRYDPLIAAALPTVEIDPRHGQALFSTSHPEPGLVLVQLKSSDGSLNEVPGDVVEFHLPTLSTVPGGTVSPISLDPALTFLIDPQGHALPLIIEPASVLIEGRIPGAVQGLVLGNPGSSGVPLSWSGDCGTADRFAVYRGALDLGYASLAPEPGACEVSGTSATVPLGAGDADFFLVVPHTAGLEGSFGQGPEGARPVPGVTCHPQGTIDECAP